MKRNTPNWSNFCMLLRRTGFTASAGLSCSFCQNNYEKLIHKPSEDKFILSRRMWLLCITVDQFFHDDWCPT